MLVHKQRDRGDICIINNAYKYWILIQKIVTGMDPSGNGTVEFEEFAHIMNRYPPSIGSEDELSNAIEAISGNSDKVSLLKLRTCLTNFGDVLTDDELDIFYSRFGPCPADDVAIKDISNKLVNG